MNTEGFQQFGPNIATSRAKLGTERKCWTDWRRGWDSNPRDPFRPNGFQDRRIQPLCHPSDAEIELRRASTRFRSAVVHYRWNRPGLNTQPRKLLRNRERTPTVSYTPRAIGPDWRLLFSPLRFDKSYWYVSV